MDQRISIITLGVSNLVLSRQFYLDLGWQTDGEPDADIVTFNLQGFAFALYSREDLANDAQIEFSDAMYAPITLAHNVHSPAEVDSILTHVQNAGGRLIKPGQKASWGGYSGYFADLDNHSWEVAHNPYSRLGPNGEFRWGGYE